MLIFTNKGGLISGIAAYVKSIAPEIKIIGCEATDAAGMTISLRNGLRTQLATCGLFADGAAVKMVGEETFNVCKDLVDGMITISVNHCLTTHSLYQRRTRFVRL